LVRREAVRAQDRLQLTASLVGAELDAYIGAGRQRLATVAGLPGLTYGLSAIQEASSEGRIPPWTTLHYLFFKSPVFTGGALLLDRDGKVLWSEPPGRPWIGRRLGDNPTVAEARESGSAALSRGLPADELLPAACADRRADPRLGGRIAGHARRHHRSHRTGVHEDPAFGFDGRGAFHRRGRSG